MVVPRLVRQALLGDEVTVYGDGTQSRCFLHVQDAVGAILALAGHEDACGRAFNVGGSSPITILELAQRVVEMVGSTSPITFVPYEQAYGEGFEELGRRMPATTAVRELTGWRPQRTLDDALDDVIAYQQRELTIPAGQPSTELRRRAARPATAPTPLPVSAR